MPYKNKTNKEYQREYYLKNKDGNTEKHWKYYEMNKEKILHYNEEYIKRNTIFFEEYRRNYYIKNKDRILEYNSNYSYYKKMGKWGLANEKMKACSIVTNDFKISILND
jgi:hypothetical protein